MDSDKIGIFVLIGWLVLCVGIVIGGWIAEPNHDKNIILSQDTADNICQIITGNEIAIAKDWYDFSPRGTEPIEKGELYCQLPIYDSTQKIKVGVGK